MDVPRQRQASDLAYQPNHNPAFMPKASGTESKDSVLQHLSKHSSYLEHERHQDALIDECLKCNIFPKGLKVTCVPQIRNPNQEFLTRWANILKECSLNLLQLCADHHSELIDKAKEDEQKLLRKLQHFIPDDTEYNSKINFVKNNKEQLRHYLFKGKKN